MKKNRFWCGLLLGFIFLGGCTATGGGKALPVDIYYSPDAIHEPYVVVGGDVGLVPVGMTEQYLETVMSKQALKKGADALLVRKLERLGPDPGIPMGAPVDRAEQVFGVLPETRIQEVRIEAEFIKYE